MRKSSITFRKFLNLKQDEQYKMMVEQGIFICKVERKERIFALYAVEKFFVELEYDKVRNIIIGKQAFVAGVKLDDYVPLEIQALLK